MSRTIVSYVIAGCEVTNKLHRDVEVRGCGHPTDTSAFCPQCGKPMYLTERQPIPGYYEDERLVIGDSSWMVVSDERGRNPRRFVGVVLARVAEWEGTAARVKQLDEVALGELRKALTSINLWDSDTYGIWNVLHAS